MAGLDLDALKGVQEDLSKRGNGDGLFLNAKDIGEETDFRIAEPKANLNGLYFMELTVWWIGNKKYTSPATFGKPDPIQEEYDEALESDDDELKQLAKDKEKFKRANEFWIPGMLLKCKFVDGDLSEVEVVDDNVKILNSGPMLMKRINKVVTSRKAQNGTAEGITHRSKGFNLILSKTGKKLDTEYDAALGEQWEMPDKYYTDKAVPDILQMAKDSIKSDNYLRAIARNYLYGEAKPAEEEKKDTGRSKPKDDEDEKPSGRRSAPKQEETKSSGRRTLNVDDDDDEKPTKRKEAGGAPVKRNVLRDLSNLDD